MEELPVATTPEAGPRFLPDLVTRQLALVTKLGAVNG